MQAVPHLRNLPAPERHPRGAQRGAQIQLLAVALSRGWQVGEQIQTLVQVHYSFGEGQALERQYARLVPKRDRLCGLLGLGIMVRQQLGLAIPYIWETLLDHPSDLAVQLLPPPPEQRIVGGILHQGVLEGVNGIGRGALLESQS